MNRAAIGWVWVTAQVVILGALTFLPGRTDWPTPGWVEATGFVLIAVGFGTVVLAGLGLGSALTPTPVPTARGTLNTAGFYRYVRHPIYTGVLAIVVGLTLRSGSFVHLAIAALAVVFFSRKAQWEETQLELRYPQYLAYSRATPKFIPRPWSR